MCAFIIQPNMLRASVLRLARSAARVSGAAPLAAWKVPNPEAARWALSRSLYASARVDDASKHEFKAETRQLLDIVASSLYRS
jgi:hypothetical protein